MLIRAFLWGNDLKAFPLLKSAIFAFPHECHLKPTTTTTTWNSKQKLKSAIFCFFYQSFFKKNSSFSLSVKHGASTNEPYLNAKEGLFHFLPGNGTKLPLTGAILCHSQTKNNTSWYKFQEDCYYDSADAFWVVFAWEKTYSRFYPSPFTFSLETPINTGVARGEGLS